MRYRDSFGIVLVLLILTMLVIAVLDELAYSSTAAVAIQAAAILVIYRTSKVSRRGMIVALSISAVAVVATAATETLVDPGRALVVATVSLMALLLLGPYVIARRLRDFDHIGLETVFAALCIYLIIGLFFSVLYRLIGNVSAEPFFVEAGDPSAMDSLYFSFTTLTTLGYGDLTPAGDIGRMLAITQALLGQVYLVTVVALIVANLGRKKDREARRQRRENR